MNQGAALPLSPLDPVAARRRAMWVTVLSLAAAAGVVFLEETWLARARVRLDRGEPLGKALGGALDCRAAVGLAVVLFAAAEIFRAALSLARAAGATGLAKLPPSPALARVALAAAFGAASAPSSDLTVRLLSAVGATVWAGALVTCGIGRGAALLAAASVMPVATWTRSTSLFPAWLLAAGAADAVGLAMTASARRAPLLGVFLGDLYVLALLGIVGRQALLGNAPSRMESAVVAGAGLLFFGVAYGLRAWRRRSRR